MDHVTRCPNCSTAFRVTDEQLAAFQGKVRCGRCALVFNALDALIPQTPPAPQAAPEIPADPELPHTTTEDETHDWAPPSVAELYSQTQADIDAVAPTETDMPEPVEPFSALDENEAPDALMQTDETAPTPEETAAREEVLGGYRPIAMPEDEALFAPLAKPRHARLWTFFALLATLILVLQILFAYRVNMVMEFPALQPRFTKVCDTLGCKMPLPRQAERLRLEWSELTYVPDHPTLIQLSATLRNLAPFEQGLPQLELTLTDTQERVVARRIFRPAEYLTSSEKTRRSLLGYDELHAFLQLEVGNLKSTGYSMYWFYD